MNWKDIVYFTFTLALLTFLAAWSSYSHADNPLVDPQKQIFAGCAMKAEMTLYIAQERLYNNGSEQKLLAFMQQNMNEAQFRLNEAVLEQLGNWVDTHDFGTAKEYSRSVMAECVANSFHIMKMEPDENTDGYINRFEEILDNAHEELFPSDYESDRQIEA